MRLVLDTNVLVSGLLNPHGPPGRILDLVLAGKLRLVVDDRIADEYREVLLRPRFGFDPAAVAALLTFVEGESEWVSALPVAIALADVGDQPFAEVAIASAADFLVTGNPRHFPATQLPKGMRVVTPVAFLAAAGLGE